MAGFFERFSPDDADAIRALGRRTELRRGESLFRRGDPARFFYWIEMGGLRVEVSSGQGKDLVLRRLGPGDVFGEIALFTDTPRTATVVAHEPTRVRAVDGRDFRDLVRRRPSVALSLIEVLADRTRHLSEQLEDSFFLPMRARLAKTLLGIARQSGDSTGAGIRLAEPLSQALLARMVYSSREEVNRELGRWSRRGWIRRQRGRLEILDPPALEALVETAGG